MAGGASVRSIRKSSLTLEERKKRSIRAKRHFRALVRLVIENRSWLEEVIDEELGENVKRNVQLLTKKKEMKSLITIKHKAILNKPAEYRTESEKLMLYRAIGGLKCFRKYPEHVKMQLASVTYFYYYGTGRVIVRQNQAAYALYFIVSGEVTVSITSFDPVLNETVTANVGIMVAGNMFGEVSLLHDIPRTATITTATPCELLCLKRADFDTVLKSSVQAQWLEIMRSMKKFRYFDGWDVVAVRECCILAKKILFKENSTILGDGFGDDRYVHFIINGKCRVIEHLLMLTHVVRGVKKYKLYIPPIDPLEQEWSKNTFEPKSASVAYILPTPTNSPVSVNENFGSKTQLKMSTSEVKYRPASLNYIPQKNKIGIRESNVYIPPNVQTHFMQVCIYSESACFNLGENMQRRRIVAITDVECMLIPKFWIFQRNTGNIWTRIQQFLDSRIPSTKEVFKEFLAQRSWQAHKQKLIDSILPYPPSNIINNVPYSIRIKQDIKFAGELKMLIEMLPLSLENHDATLLHRSLRYATFLCC